MAGAGENQLLKSLWSELKTVPVGYMYDNQTRTTITEPSCRTDPWPFTVTVTNSSGHDSQLWPIMTPSRFW